MTGKELRANADRVNAEKKAAEEERVREQVRLAVQECKKASDLGKYEADFASYLSPAAVEKLNLMDIGTMNRSSKNSDGSTFHNWRLSF